MAKFLLTLSALAVAIPMHAQAPGGDPRALAVTPQVGPWMVMVTTFMGPESGQLAYDFAVELRQKYRLPAYCYNHAEQQRREAEAEQDQKRRHQISILEKYGADPTQVALPVRKVHFEDEYAVLVGGYRDIDEAHAAMERMRKLPFPSQRFCAANFQPVPGSDPQQPKYQPEFLNPFRTCFVAPNPTLPREAQNNKPDPFWKRLNENEEYSVLKCPKPWTLVIIELPGAAAFQTQAEDNSPNLLEKLLGSKDHAAEYLDASSTQAHEIARALRQLPLLREMGLQTYVLHTRTSSIVTIGAFDNQADPTLRDAQRRLAALKLNVHTGVQFRCFAVPMPMRVPQL